VQITPSPPSPPRESHRTARWVSRRPPAIFRDRGDSRGLKLDPSHPPDIGCLSRCIRVPAIRSRESQGAIEGGYKPPCLARARVLFSGILVERWHLACRLQGSIVRHRMLANVGTPLSLVARVLQRSLTLVNYFYPCIHRECDLCLVRRQRQVLFRVVARATFTRPPGFSPGFRAQGGP